jgi:Septum formation
VTLPPPPPEPTDPNAAPTSEGGQFTQPGAAQPEQVPHQATQPYPNPQQAPNPAYPSRTATGETPGYPPAPGQASPGYGAAPVGDYYAPGQYSVLPAQPHGQPQYPAQPPQTPAQPYGQPQGHSQPQWYPTTQWSAAPAGAHQQFGSAPTTASATQWGPGAPKKSHTPLTATISAIIVTAFGAVAYFIFFAGDDLSPLASDVDSKTTAQAQQLSAGNCLAELPSDEPVGEVTVVPCSDPHPAQVVASKTFASASFPGESNLVAKTTQMCTPALITSDIATGDLTYTVWTPSEGSWADGDRVGLCVVSSTTNLSASLID